MEPDPVLDRRAPRIAAAQGAPRKSYQCPVPGTMFQEWLPVQAASADEIVAEMNKQTRNFNNPSQCLPAAAYGALVNPGGSAAPLAAAAAPAPGTLSRAELVAIAQALEDLKIARVRAILERRDADNTAPVMARLQPVETSLAAEWAALPAEPLARMQQVLSVRTKYLPVLGPLQQELAAQGPQNARSPVIAIARRLEPSVNAQIVAAMEQPEVRQAWIAGSLQLPLDLLPRAQQRDWAADRLTASLARDAATQLGASTALFMTRTDDLQQSKRERDDVHGHAGWGEPTANEIGLALLRAVAQDGGRHTTPAEAERIGPSHLLLELSNTSIRHVTRVVHVHKAACARGAEGWSCDVRLWVHNLVRGLSQEALASLGFTAVPRAELAFRDIGIAGPQLTGQPARLTLTPTRAGWTAPGFAAAIAADEQKVVDQMRRMAAKAQEEERCAARNVAVYGWDNHQPCF